MTRTAILSAAGALALAACQPPSAPASGQAEAPQTGADGQTAMSSDERAQARRGPGYPPPAENAADDAAPAQQTQEASLLTGPLSDGQWVFKEMASGPAALFGPPSTDAAFTLRCDTQDGAMVMARAGRLQGNSQELMTLATPNDTRRYYVQEAGTELPRLTTRVRAGDSSLDRLARSEGPIAVSLEYQDNVLRMPADPVIGRVIEQCRQA